MGRTKKELGLDSMGIQKSMRLTDYLGDGIGQLPLNIMSSLVGQLTYFYTEKVGLAAGMVAIPSELHEAAIIDGCGKWQKIRYITLYMLRPLIIMLCLIQIGNIFYSDFGMYYFLTKDNGMLYSVTDVIDTYIFRALKTVNDPGMGAAVGLFQSLMGFILVLASNAVAKKIDEEGAIF